MPSTLRKDILTGETQKRKASLSTTGKSSRTPSQRASVGRTSRPSVSSVCRAINFSQTLKENNSKQLLNGRSPAVASSQTTRSSRPLSQVNHQSSNNTAVNILRQHRANLLRNNARNSLQSANQRRLEHVHRNSLDKEHLIKHGDEDGASKLTSLLSSAKLSNENGHEKTPNGKQAVPLTSLNNSTSKLDGKPDSRRASLTSRLSGNRPSNEPTKPPNVKQSNSKTLIKASYPNAASPSLIKPPTAQLIHHDHHSPAHQNADVFNYSNLNSHKLYDDDLHCISESHELRSTAAQRQADHRLYAEQNLSASCNRLSQASSKSSNTSNLPSVAAVASSSTPSLNGLASGSPAIPHSVMRNYEVGELIGEGNFAVVHQCMHKRTRRKYALKVIDKTKCAGKEAMIENEVAILRKIKHPNIVSLHEDYDYPNELYLVMELVVVSKTIISEIWQKTFDYPVVQQRMIIQICLLEAKFGCEIPTIEFFLQGNSYSVASRTAFKCESHVIHTFLNWLVTNGY